MIYVLIFHGFPLKKKKVESGMVIIGMPPIIPALGSQRQENCKSKTRLGYIVQGQPELT
jgi:hypothetical protein